MSVRPMPYYVRVYIARALVESGHSISRAEQIADEFFSPDCTAINSVVEHYVEANLFRKPETGIERHEREEWLRQNP